MSTQQDIDEIIEQLKPHEMETVKIKPVPEAPKNQWNSKFGGKAYWPKGIEYPTSKEGEALFLLSQINFEEMPHLAGYPKSGILQFFIENDELYGLDFDTPLDEIIKKPSGYRVIYHPEFFTEVENNLPSIPEDCMLPLYDEFSLIFTLDKELPSVSDYRFNLTVGNVFDFDDEVSDYLYENIEATGSKIGGYAYFTQEDPRCYEKTNENWLLLFQMDTSDCDGVDIMWGDCGVGNFFIKPEELVKCDFSKVWYNWDCS